MKGYPLRWPKQNLTRCPGWVDYYKLDFPTWSRHFPRRLQLFLPFHYGLSKWHPALNLAQEIR